MRRPAPSLRGRALQWLAQREHSRQELRDKLLRWARAQRTVAASSALTALAASQSDDSAACTEVDVADDAQAIEHLLDELQAAGHLSQQRFVESRIHARAARFGNRRIEQELRHLGAEPDPAARAALQASEAERARQVWRRKFGKLGLMPPSPPASPAERARQMRFLAGRGFSADTIRRVLGAQGHDQAEGESVERGDRGCSDEG